MTLFSIILLFHRKHSRRSRSRDRSRRSHRSRSRDSRRRSSRDGSRSRSSRDHRSSKGKSREKSESRRDSKDRHAATGAGDDNAKSKEEQQDPKKEEKVEAEPPQVAEGGDCAKETKAEDTSAAPIDLGSTILWCLFAKCVTTAWYLNLKCRIA